VHCVMNRVAQQGDNSRNEISIREHNRHEWTLTSGESIVADGFAEMLARSGTFFLWM